MNSEATFLLGGIEIAGVAKDKCEELALALAQVVSEDGFTSKVTHPLAKKLIQLRTRWKKHPRTPFVDAHDVTLRDFIIDTKGQRTYILGVEDYDCWKRDDVLYQLNWIIAWIKSLYTRARFGGRIDQWDEGWTGETPLIYKPSNGKKSEVTVWSTRLELWQKVTEAELRL